MIEEYNPNYGKYDSLWNKFLKGELTQGSLPVPKIDSQESAVRWSLAIKSLLDDKAIKNEINLNDLESQFAEGVNHFVKGDYSRLEWGLAWVNRFIRAVTAKTLDVTSSVNHTGEAEILINVARLDFAQARQDIDQHNLLFDFDSLEDLFFETEDSKNGVYTIE